MTAPQDAQDANLTPSPAGVASVPTVDAAAAQEGHYPEPHGKDWWCAECLQVLDGEDGVCNLVLLARRVIALEHSLYDWQQVVQVEGWGATPRCRGCGASPAFTGAHPRSMPVHAAGCWVAALVDGEAR